MRVLSKLSFAFAALLTISGPLAALPQQRPNCTDISRPELCTPGTNLPTVERTATDDRRLLPERSTFEPGIDRPGKDYRNFTMASPDARACESVCRKEGRCTAWTYVRAGVQGPAPRCWLKTEVPAQRRNACCTSGIVGRN
jgi:hypothetical protein